MSSAADDIANRFAIIDNTTGSRLSPTWVDSMASEIMVTEGDYASKNHTMTLYSKGTEPSGKPYDARMSTKYEAEDTMVFTMEMKSEETKGEYIKVMEIAYKRRSK